MFKEVSIVDYKRVSELGTCYLVVTLAYLYVGYGVPLLRALVLILESFVACIWLNQY